MATLAADLAERCAVRVGVRIGELDVVQRIESLGPELRLDPLRDLESFENGSVQIIDPIGTDTREACRERTNVRSQRVGAITLVALPLNRGLAPTCFQHCPRI